jgi:flagellin
VGDNTYVISSADQKLSSDVPAASATVKYINVKDGDSATDIADKLAKMITTTEGANGKYTADVTGGVLTIHETTNYGKDVLAGTKTAGKGADIIKNETYNLSAGSSGISGKITLDAKKTVNGTTVTVGDKSYMLTDDSTMAALAGTTAVVYKAGDTGDMAKQLAAKLTADNFTNVSATGTEIVFATSQDGNGQLFEASAKGAGLKLQIGDTSDSFNQLGVTIGDMHVAGIGIDKISIATAEDAQAAVSVIKTAINTVSSTRGDLGAIQNRLEHTSNNLSVMSENIQDAESTIRDTDIAEEMMSYTKNNILVQSAQAMLAQANQVPQGVLQLLQ